MRTELTGDEKQATIDAINRFKANDPDLEKLYEIEFVIANFTELELNPIELFLKENKINFNHLKRNKSDVLVVIKMRLDKEKLLEIEAYLTYFANEHDFIYDGWGAFE